MKERPILFSAPMVRAILDGRKTQTRRILRNQPVELPDYNRGHLSINIGGARYTAWNAKFPPIRCPYGQPGDRLWVRETWQGPLLDYDQWDAYREDHRRFETPAFCRYAADGGAPPEFVDDEDELQCKWRPSIHMPRWASRITLEVTGVRVERLQEISPQDVRAEGCEVREFWLFGADAAERQRIAANVYRSLWEQINGAGSWEANPWVWVVSFRRVKQEPTR